MKPLFNRLAGRHLDDASLAAIWTSMTAAGASVTAGASDPHLASCGECRVRYDAFASWMEEIRTDARLEADEIFTPERLAAQQAVIIQAPRSCRASGPRDRISEVLIEHHRTIRPGSALDRRRSRRRPSRRAWSRADHGPASLWRPANLSRRSYGSAATRRCHGRAAVPANAGGNEEVLLLELEAAATPQYEALRAYETLTPRAADFLQSSR